MSSIGWLPWQDSLLDDYILGYTTFETQEELADKIGKTLNAVKVKLSRRKQQIEEESRELTFDEYKLFLSNRFDKTTKQVADLIGVSESFLLMEIDEIDSLECKEYFEEDFQNRIVSPLEYKIFIRLYIEQSKNKFQIAHILNRPIHKIQEMVKNYEVSIQNSPVK